MAWPTTPVQRTCRGGQRAISQTLDNETYDRWLHNLCKSFDRWIDLPPFPADRATWQVCNGWMVHILRKFRIYFRYIARSHWTRNALSWLESQKKTKGTATRTMVNESSKGVSWRRQRPLSFRNHRIRDLLGGEKWNPAFNSSFLSSDELNQWAVKASRRLFGQDAR